MDAEKLALVQCLDRQRHHVLGILDGLTEEQLRRPVLPSGWTCAGLVRHLALDVEHYWFRCIVGGESLGFFASESATVSATESDGGAGAWEVPPGEPAVAVLDRYRDEVERADAVLARTELDAAPAQPDPWWGEWEVADVRFILLHVIAETACHAGHLDAARELIDGRQWVVL